MRSIFCAMLLMLAGGCGIPSFLVTPVPNVQKLQEVQVQSGRRDKIAIIEIEGMLVNARTGGFLQPSENKLALFAEQLNAAARDRNVKAVVLRVNSPGGTVTTSDTMYEMLLRFREKTGKPVIASCQEVSASGAYYLSCAADKIVAHPTSVIGSIGVIFNTFEFQGTLNKIGMRAEAIKSGRLKDMGSPFHPLSQEEREVMQAMVDEYYVRFVDIVKKHRPVSQNNIEMVTDGRVFSGLQAKALGLVDETGMLSDAIRMAKQQANAPGARVIMYKRPYGHRGSIYASAESPPPEANVLKLDLPDSGLFLPSGFYYLWRP